MRREREVRDAAIANYLLAGLVGFICGLFWQQGYAQMTKFWPAMILVAVLVTGGVLMQLGLAAGAYLSIGFFVLAGLGAVLAPLLGAGRGGARFEPRAFIIWPLILFGVLKFHWKALRVLRGPPAP